MNIESMSIKEIAASLQDKEISSKELLQWYIDRIEKFESKINAVVTINENALKDAEEWDNKRAKGENVPLYAGIPLGIKDNICTEGLKTTCSSKILNNFVPPYNATVIKQLKESGFIVLAKMNMDEFAMGSSCETSRYMKTKNPWDISRVPGGSSGGSAASVAASFVPAALGSDTGGSIRQPASFCGITGLKPTYGRVSRYGLIAFASSLDQIGPMTKSAEDSACLLDIIGKHDKSDSTSAVTTDYEYSKMLNGNIKGKKIGIPKEYFNDGLDSEVKAIIDNALKQYEELGAEIVEISMPHTDYAVSVYYIIATAEASSNLARYDGVKYGYRAAANDLYSMYTDTRSDGFGEEVKRRIMLGTYVLSAGYYDAYYLKAQKVRTLIKSDFEDAFNKVDLIVSPTSPTTAFKFGEKSDPIQMYLSDIYTISLNLFGGCGISIPCGFDSKGLPVGLQLSGGYFKETDLLNASYAYQNVTDWHKRVPNL